MLYFYWIIIIFNQIYADFFKIILEFWNGRYVKSFILKINSWKFHQNVLTSWGRTFSFKFWAILSIELKGQYDFSLYNKVLRENYYSHRKNVLNDMVYINHPFEKMKHENCKQYLLYNFHVLSWKNFRVSRH